MSVLFAVAFHGPGGVIVERHHNISEDEVAALVRDPRNAAFAAQIVRTETVWSGWARDWQGQLQPPSRGT
jgi:hypothetical protein